LPRQQGNGEDGANQTIAEYLSTNDSFSMLMQLVERSPRIQELFQAGESGSGGSGGARRLKRQEGNEDTFTVWAPTNEAFSKILNNPSTQELAQNFTEPRADQFIDFLLAYHITNGTFNVTEELSETGNVTVQTALGFVGINISSTDGDYKANDANILDPEGVVCTDGAVYPIDGVLSPLYFLGIDLSQLQVSEGGQANQTGGGNGAARRRIRL